MPETVVDYATGQLNAMQVARLRRHLARCPACRAQLAEYRDLADDLSLALSIPTPSSERTDHWWRSIQSRRQRPRHASLAPALLALALLAATMITPSSARAFTPPASTFASAAINTPLAPPAIIAAAEESTPPVQITPATPVDTVGLTAQPSPPPLNR